MVTCNDEELRQHLNTAGKNATYIITNVAKPANWCQCHQAWHGDTTGDHCNRRKFLQSAEIFKELVAVEDGRRKTERDRSYVYKQISVWTTKKSLTSSANSTVVVWFQIHSQFFSMLTWHDCTSHEKWNLNTSGCFNSPYIVDYLVWQIAWTLYE